MREGLANEIVGGRGVHRVLRASILPRAAARAALEFATGIGIGIGMLCAAKATAIDATGTGRLRCDAQPICIPKNLRRAERWIGPRVENSRRWTRLMRP
jgi:hypothetical protein